MTCPLAGRGSAGQQWSATADHAMLPPKRSVGRLRNTCPHQESNLDDKDLLRGQDGGKLTEYHGRHGLINIVDARPQEPCPSQSWPMRTWGSDWHKILPCIRARKLHPKGAPPARQLHLHAVLTGDVCEGNSLNSAEGNSLNK